MPQNRRSPRLPQKSLPHLLPGSRHGGRFDDFQRHRTVKDSILGAIRHPHGAAPQFPQRAIVAPHNFVITKNSFIVCFVKSETDEARHALTGGGKRSAAG
jgi:hypothetical protein